MVPLLRSQGVDFGIVGRTFNPAVPTLIIIRPIPVLFAVGFVVLVIVTDKITEREPIMRGQEIQTRARAPAVVRIKITASSQSRCQFADRAAVPFPKTPDTIAIFPIPLRPEHGKIANLITLGPNIPRFGNQFHFRQDGVLLYKLKNALNRSTSHSSRASALARSKRNPSTCISVAQ